MIEHEPPKSHVVRFPCGAGASSATGKRSASGTSRGALSDDPGTSHKPVAYATLDRAAITNVVVEWLARHAGFSLPCTFNAHWQREELPGGSFALQLDIDIRETGAEVINLAAHRRQRRSRP
jgi:hypothetical protein